MDNDKKFSELIARCDAIGCDVIAMVNEEPIANRRKILVRAWHSLTAASEALDRLVERECPF